MIRRKCFAALVAAVLGMGALFAQTAKYTELLNKAEAYEEKKEWCYALGYYYDAIVEDPANAEEAMTHYTAIRNAIKAGKPGLGEYNEFTLHDSWIPLLQNTEKYWTEFCPEYFTFGEIQKGAVDFKTRTASYSISIKSNSSAKYNEIQGLIKDGYQTAYRSDWTDMPEYWPSTSIFSTSGGAMQKGAALFINGNRIVPAFCSDLYDLKFSICDENGTELLKSGRYLEKMGSYTFDKVPADIMAIIDAGKVKPKLTAIFLEYGTYNKADDTGGRGFVKHFQELVIPLEQNEKNGTHLTLEEVFAEEKVTEKNKDNEVFVEGSGEINDFYMWKTEVTQAQYQSVMGNDPSKFKGDNHPMEWVSWYDAVAYCNKKSEQEGLIPCYSGSGDNITCDFTANGYRLPTSAEWEYAAKGGKDVQSYTYAGSDSIDEVAWYGGNSAKMTHDVATKKSNTLGIYDMSGNVWEWCWDASGFRRVNRGGSYCNYGLDCTVSDSRSHDPSDEGNNLGLRVVRSSSVK